jgi:hypothetical protein
MCRQTSLDQTNQVPELTAGSARHVQGCEVGNVSRQKRRESRSHAESAKIAEKKNGGDYLDLPIYE